jgi:hypothetical protein
VNCSATVAGVKYIKSAVAMVVGLGNRRQLSRMRLYASFWVCSAAMGMHKSVCESATAWRLLYPSGETVACATGLR